MSEKVLGFKDNPELRKQMQAFTSNNDKAYVFFERDKVPVVSLQAHEKEIEKLKDRCEFWINKVRHFEECLRKEKFTTVSGETWIKK